MNNLEMLNQKFGIVNFLKFVKGSGELDTAVIKNKFARVEIVLMGANILKYKPKNEEDVLWYSSKSSFAFGKPIRGGIPICFPWFGPHPDVKGMPLHGFARLKNWEVETSEMLSNGSIKLILTLRDDEESLSLWNYSFKCSLTVI